MNRAYPEGWSMDLLRVLDAGDVVVSEVRVPFKDEAATRPHRSGVAGSPNRNGPVLAKAAASPEDKRYGRKEVVRQMSEQPATPEVAGC